MGTTSYPVNDALAVKLWARVIDHETLKYTEIAPLIGESKNSIIHLQTALSKGPGDQITYGLITQLSQLGFTENDLAEGNGETLNTQSDSLLINELLYNVGVKGPRTIDQKRVPFSLRDEAKWALRDRYAKSFSVSFFNQVCGYTPASDVRLTGLNPVPAATRIIRQSNRASDDLLVAGDTFTLNLIDKAKEQAVTATPPIRPVSFNGRGNSSRADFDSTLENMYVMYLHPYQVTAMRTNTSTGSWMDFAKTAYMGRGKNNPIFSGAIGMYNGVILRSAFDVTNGVSATGTDVPNAKRAVLLGGQAAMMGFGKDNSTERYTWNEELFDHKRRMEVSAMAIWGLKKTRFGGTDYGAIVVSTYAAAAV